MMLPEPNIILAVKNNDLPWLRRLLDDKNVDVDEDDIGGWTALHQAADHQNAEAAMLLLAHHADPTLENGMGLTARDSARIQFDKHGDFEVLRAVDAAILRREAVRAWIRWRRGVARARAEAAVVAVVVARKRGQRVATWRPWLAVRYRPPSAACRAFRLHMWRDGLIGAKIRADDRWRLN